MANEWFHKLNLVQTNVNNYSCSPANYCLSNPDEHSKSFICKAAEEKDFGVWCRSDMKTSLQVQKACKHLAC